ncbi:cobalamin-binding protein [bacterium]|nr:cobalamin-binding protein [bacterium]
MIGNSIIKILLISLSLHLSLADYKARDDRGKLIVLKKAPNRIVSLAPATTEMLFAIGVGNKVVGVTTYCNYPSLTKNIPKVGGFINPSLENIVKLKPDLIVAMRGNPLVLLERLEKMGYPVFALNPKSVSDVLKGMKKLGELTGSKEANRVVMNLMGRLEKIRKEVAKIPYERRPKVVIELWYNPLIVFGKESIGDEVIELAGGRNIMDGKVAYPQISLETLIERQPDVIILAHMTKVQNPLSEVKRRANWDKLKAVREGRVYAIDADIIDRPGPRLIQAVEILHRLLYQKR